MYLVTKTCVGPSPDDDSEMSHSVLSKLLLTPAAHLWLHHAPFTSNMNSLEFMDFKNATYVKLCKGKGETIGKTPF